MLTVKPFQATFESFSGRMFGVPVLACASSDNCPLLPPSSQFVRAFQSAGLIAWTTFGYDWKHGQVARASSGVSQKKNLKWEKTSGDSPIITPSDPLLLPELSWTNLILKLSLL